MGIISDAIFCTIEEILKMHLQGLCGTKDIWSHGIQSCDSSMFELEEVRLDYCSSYLWR